MDERRVQLLGLLIAVGVAVPGAARADDDAAVAADTTATGSAVVATAEATDGATGTPEGAAGAPEGSGYEGRSFPDQPEDGGAVLPDLFINAESGVMQDVLRSSPIPHLTAADVDSVVSPMDEEVLTVSPVAGILPHLNNLVDLESHQVPHYWLPEMSTAPVVTFHADKPTSGTITSWELKIVNFRGLPVKGFKGSGPPPRKIEWDGRDERGDMIAVGFPYSYVITVTDKGTNTYNYGGASFRISALDYTSDDSRFVEITGNRLFPRKGSKLEPRGEQLIDKATDAFREHPLSAILLTVVAPAEKLGRARADAIVERVAEALIIPPQEIKVRVEVKPETAVEQDGFVRFEIPNAG